jgi:hypothetical protein
MQYVCDAPKGKTWFRIETEGEAVHESRLMGHTTAASTIGSVDLDAVPP